MLMGAIVIDHQMDGEIRRDMGVDVFEKIEILLMAMAFFAVVEDFSGSDVESGKERGRAVADIVVGHAFDIAQAHRENGLGTIQRLNLALLVDAQDHGVLGRMEIQPDNIADLFDEKGIIGDFEMALAMGLKTKGAPDSLDRRPKPPYIWFLARNSGTFQFCELNGAPSS
jgi:hypothetical protein